MSGKSRRKQGKHLSQRKKRKSTLTRAAQQQPISQTHEPTPHPAASAPSASVPASKATLTTARNPYIVTELRTIGILAGIIMAILVVLAFVLP